MEKKQTGAGVSQHKRTSKKKRPDAGSHVTSSERNKNQGEKGMLNNGKKADTNHVEKDDRSGKRKKRAVVFVLVITVVLFALMLLRGCNKGDLRKVHLDMPEFEDSAGLDNVGNQRTTKDGVNLAVIPDFTVTEDNQSFVIPYPENEYDAEFYFVDKESGEERYRTKRIKPGSVVRIPAFSFCEDGEHTYRVEVGVFDGDSFEEVPSAVALEMNITKIAGT